MNRVVAIVGFKTVQHGRDQVLDELIRWAFSLVVIAPVAS
jgi:hypothetical protein